VTDLPVAEFGEAPRYATGSRFARPQYHLHLVDIYSRYETDPEHGLVRERVDRIKIPLRTRWTIVCAGQQEVDFELLSSSYWLADD